jgi:nucleoside-diphosphate-sugar epimerase
MRHILITGASGFLGKCLLKEMLASPEDCFHLLVRSEKAEQEILGHLSAWDELPACPSSMNGQPRRLSYSEDEQPGRLPHPERLHFIRGDVSQPHLGVDATTLASLSRHVDEVWHLAASTSFSEKKRREIETVNLTGTQHFLKAVGQFDRLKKFFHMSTAFVCGNRTDVIPEDRFPSPKSFRNPYEETKYHAEELVRQSGLPAVILRPSVLMGDSRTGDTYGETRMVYGYFLAMYCATLHAFGGAKQFLDYWHNGHDRTEPKDLNARLRLRHSAPLNTLTVDYAVRVCLAIRNNNPHPDPLPQTAWARGSVLFPSPVLCTGEGQGEGPCPTYNIVSARSLPVGLMADVMQRLLKVRGFRYEPSPWEPTNNSAEACAHRHTEMFWPYVLAESEPKWADHNVAALGLPRVPMTEELFEFLIQRYVETELVNRNSVCR